MLREHGIPLKDLFIGLGISLFMKFLAFDVSPVEYIVILNNNYQVDCWSAVLLFVYQDVI